VSWEECSVRLQEILRRLNDNDAAHRDIMREIGASREDRQAIREELHALRSETLPAVALQKRLTDLCWKWAFWLLVAITTGALMVYQAFPKLLGLGKS
jgi:hypothetical protein